MDELFQQYPRVFLHTYSIVWYTETGEMRH